MNVENSGTDSLEHDPPDGAWSVSALNDEIERVLTDADERFPRHVVGEVAEVSHYDFGTFFELRDLEDDPVIGCLAWSTFREAFDHELEAGAKAVVEATVDFYPERGDTQLLVSDYWPLGESARQQKLAALRDKLEGEGLFETARKQPLPDYPACVGLVTSASGSAREDVWAAVSERSPRTTVKLSAATVQGEAAVESLVRAIQPLDHDPTVETILLTRGGGSDADLWEFNAEPLVRCVAACSTPVVAAVGHEDDETLVEDVADDRAMTPTEAGVLATTTVEAVFRDLAALERRVASAYEALTADRLQQVERRIESGLETQRQQYERRLSRIQRASDLERRIGTAYRTRVDERLDDIVTRIGEAVTEIELAAEAEAASERVARGRLSDLESRIDAAYRSHVEGELDRREQRLDAALRDVEARTRIAAGTAEVQRLRVVVAVLVGLLVLGTLAVLFLFVL